VALRVTGCSAKKAAGRDRHHLLGAGSGHGVYGTLTLYNDDRRKCAHHAVGMAGRAGGKDQSR
jgi:hypothetical protein